MLDQFMKEPKRVMAITFNGANPFKVNRGLLVVATGRSS